MKPCLLLMRGINVGGKNKVSMAALRTCLEELGFSHVTTYIASGNAIVQSDKKPAEIKTLIEATLPKAFELDTELIKVLALTHGQLQSVVDNKPTGFGDQPDKYHSDAIFLIDIDIAEAMAIFNPRRGVDKIWPGNGLIYSQRLSAERTKSRLSVIAVSPLYKSMTIRNWNTTVKLLDMMNTITAN